jgi:very-short-patch-repair endonuclease
VLLLGARLESVGWCVLRFSEYEDLDAVVDEIVRVVAARRCAEWD